MPTEPWEASKVAICRAKRESVLDGQRREMRIGHEIANNPGQGEQLTNYFGVPLRRFGYPHHLSRKPTLNLLPRGRHHQRSAERPRIRCDTKERK